MSHHPVDLLDEYWFFSNSLDSSGKKKPVPSSNRSPSTSTKPQQQQKQQQQLGSGSRRRLLRTPSLPPPPIPAPPIPDNNKVPVEEVEVDDDDLNWSSIYEGVLRTRVATAHQGRGRLSSALQRAPSMPIVPSSSSDSGRRIKEKEKEEMHANSKPQRSKMMMVRSKSTLFHQAADKKNWKSSSDLESMELQGFKDLGFVFDKKELREDLAQVLPGLNNRHQHGAVRRPYLSEAWYHDRRRPALIRVQSEARSAAEVKDQLRMWAQAVACNVRQECA